MTGRRPDAAEHVREATCSLTAAEQSAVAAPADALRHAVDAREEVEMLVRGLVARLRLDGASWAAIGRQLGVTKQSAQQRYGAAADQLLRTSIRATFPTRQEPASTDRQDSLSAKGDDVCRGEQQPCPHPDHATADVEHQGDDQAAAPDGRYLLAHDAVDGWTLWRLAPDGDEDEVLGTCGWLDEDDAGDAQFWAATVLMGSASVVTGRVVDRVGDVAWVARPGRYGGEYDDQGWGPALRA
jgi:hypothetical protein